ncbi:MAG: hypothetical protein MJ123_10465 [Lachnospiraceae bacterium]|nr:hypothetical protein [Lachnospiraceae bacterium]
MRVWAKLWLDNRMLKDMVVNDYSEETRTHKVFSALDSICNEWDLGKPIWLESNVSEFKRRSKTRFSKDSFIETTDFDYLEIEILEEDY